MKYESDTDPLQRTSFIQQFRIQSDINQPFIIQQIFSDLDAVTPQAKRNSFNEKITTKINFKYQIPNLRLLITDNRLKTLIRLIFQNKKKFVCYNLEKVVQKSYKLILEIVDQIFTEK